MNEMISYEDVQVKILEIRGERVLLDRDVAELYGVGTKEINQAVKNNPDKFPVDYTHTLTKEELCQLVKNFDRFEKLKHSSALPTAFSERGLYMLATILKSPRATQTTIAIVDAFAKLRELSDVAYQLVTVKDENAQEALMVRGGEILSEIFDETIMDVIGNETSFELNLGALKIKHTVKREKRIS